MPFAELEDLNAAKARIVLLEQKLRELCSLLAYYGGDFREGIRHERDPFGRGCEDGCRACKVLGLMDYTR